MITEETLYPAENTIREIELLLARISFFFYRTCIIDSHEKENNLYSLISTSYSASLFFLFFCGEKKGGKGGGVWGERTQLKIVVKQDKLSNANH